MDSNKYSSYYDFSSGRQKRAAPRDPGPNRSVNDFGDDDDLFQALMSIEGISDDNEYTSLLNDIADGQPVQKVARVGEKSGEQVIQALDWVLPHFDPETTEPQNMKSELERLQVLKKYLILDSDREQGFERITSLASRIFDVPIALVSLVDLGRQWFMSNHGLGDVRETPRKYAFCSHAILSKLDLLEVPDTVLDFRFRDNALVTGPPYIRYYAGSPLVSPEGYKLGTLCIIDTVPRPNGLSAEQRVILCEMAEMTVKVMVDRRNQLELNKQESPSQMIAYTANDLMTPLNGLQISLSMLKEDVDVQSTLNEQSLELLHTASSCADLMVRICQDALQHRRPTNESGVIINASELDMNYNTMVGSVSYAPSNNAAQTRLVDLARSLFTVLGPMTSNVPLVLSISSTVPSVFIADDLKVFRSAGNLLSSAIQRTLVGMVGLTISSIDDTLVFECQDTGVDIPFQEYPLLFQPCTDEAGPLLVGLSSVASMISSCQGEYGFRPRSIASDGSTLSDSKGQQLTGSVFWFSIPLNAVSYERVDLEQALGELRRHIRRSGSCSNVSNQHTTIEVENDSQAVAIQESCLSSAFTPSMTVSTDQSTNIDESSRLLNIGMIDLEPVSFPHLPEGQMKVTREKRALVIDDSLVIRKSLAHALVKFGFQVEVASDGMEGLQKLKETLFDVVLCDFLMPKMDGMDCVKQYRDWESQNRPWSRQYIIGISGHANANDSGQGVRSGMDRFQAKPITLDYIGQLVTSQDVTNHTKELDNIQGASDHPINEIFQESLTLQPQSTVTGAEKVYCLVATDSPQGTTTDQALQELQMNRWHVVIVRDGVECFRQLQIRNWDIVLIDGDLPQLPGVACVDSFRKWERKYRVNRQNNLFLVCDGDIPSPLDKLSLVLPPRGFDGVLGRPVPWNDLKTLVQNSVNAAMDIVVR